MWEEGEETLAECIGLVLGVINLESEGLGSMNWMESFMLLACAIYKRGVWGPPMHIRGERICEIDRYTSTESWRGKSRCYMPGKDLNLREG